MAVGITVVQLADEGNVSLGAYPTSVVDITCDSSYPTGGYGSGRGLTAANLNCGRGINGMSQIGNNSAAVGYVADYNTETGKLEVLQSAGSAAPLAQIADGTSLTTLTFRFFVVGQR